MAEVLLGPGLALNLHHHCGCWRASPVGFLLACFAMIFWGNTIKQQYVRGGELWESGEMLCPPHSWRSSRR